MEATMTLSKLILSTFAALFVSLTFTPVAQAAFEGVKDRHAIRKERREDRRELRQERREDRQDRREQRQLKRQDRRG